MKPPSTVYLRLRGLTVGHALMSAVAAIPLAKIAYVSLVDHVPFAARNPQLVALSAVLALVPWLWRGMARALVAAKCDDVAVHVRGEALPYKTIRELRVERKRRRTILHLVRSADIRLSLVLWDAYAGRLQPLATLRERLAQHGLTFDEKI
jgi:hypothetical protein